MIHENNSQGFESPCISDTQIREKLSAIVDRVINDNTRCRVNPLFCLWRIRTGIQEDIGPLHSSRLVARMMHAAGEDFQTRRDVLDQLKNKQFRILGL